MHMYLHIYGYMVELLSYMLPYRFVTFFFCLFYTLKALFYVVYSFRRQKGSLSIDKVSKAVYAQDDFQSVCLSKIRFKMSQCLRWYVCCDICSCTDSIISKFFRPNLSIQTELPFTVGFSETSTSCMSAISGKKNNSNMNFTYLLGRGTTASHYII